MKWNGIQHMNLTMETGPHGKGGFSEPMERSTLEKAMATETWGNVGPEAMKDMGPRQRRPPEEMQKFPIRSNQILERRILASDI